MSVGEEDETRVSTKLGEDSDLRENRKKIFIILKGWDTCVHRKVQMVK